MADATYQNFDHTKQNQSQGASGKWFVNFIKRIQTYRANARAVIELRNLDNHMLKDIGVARSEIVYRVWQHKQD
jgi:uncharacterized protein YjiS (DUF1127 family)